MQPRRRFGGKAGANGLREVLDGAAGLGAWSAYETRDLRSDLILSADRIIVAPDDHRDLWTLLRALRAAPPSSPWLLYADLCLAGTFLSFLEGRPCTLLDHRVSVPVLIDSVCRMSEARREDAAANLLKRFVTHVPAVHRGIQTLIPSIRELECGCAAAMRLSIKETAELLGVSESTIKSHIHHLGQKLNLPTRRHIGAAVRAALESSVER